jgi:hypothetical protein
MAQLTDTGFPNIGTVVNADICSAESDQMVAIAENFFFLFEAVVS